MTVKRNKQILTSDQEPIIALCTARGKGSIALLRISGTGSIEVIDKIAKLSSNKKLTNAKSHTINHGFIIDPNSSCKEKVDEVLFFIMKSPKTFTGQDTVEISCHNNPFIIEKIMSLAISAGARQAKPGEFTLRAFLNNKIDLVQAESINDLIGAQTELALKKSMSQLEGSLSNFMGKIEYDFVTLLSLIEGSLEFLEEEQEDLKLDKLIKSKINQILEKLESTKLQFNQVQQIKNGIKVCIIGSVNAGKSTLFNSLLKQERAIVTKIEGTTRDVIESSLYKNGNFWMLTDTAGLRKTEDSIEKEGIDRSWNQAEQADIVLLTMDSSKKPSSEKLELYKKIFKTYKDKIIFVLNKIDQKDQNILSCLDFIEESSILQVSAKNKIGIRELEDKIENKIQEIFSKFKSPFLLNQRQHNLIVELIEKLKISKVNVEEKIEHELLASDIKEILEKISQLTGRNVTEKTLDQVFKNFCVGK